MSKAETPQSFSPQEKPKQTDEYESRRVVRINGRFLLILTLVFVVVAGGTYALHSLQMTRNAETLLVLAEEAEADGQAGKAIGYLQQYLRFQPADYDVKVRLAGLAEPLSDNFRHRLYIAGILEDVLRNDPDRPDRVELRNRIINHCMEAGKRLRPSDAAGRFRDALAHLEVLQGSPDQQEARRKSELAILEGRCHLGLGDYRKALLKFLQAIEHSPDEVSHYVKLAALAKDKPEVLPYQEDIDGEKFPRFDPEIVALFPSRVIAAQNVPKARKPRYEHGGPIASDGNDGENGIAQPMIAAIYRRIAQVGKPEHKAHLALVGYYQYRQDFAAAEKSMQAALSQAPDDADVVFAASILLLAQASKATLEVRRKNSEQVIFALLDQAAKHAKKGEKQFPKDRLRFLEQAARIEFQRTSATENKDKQAYHREKALGMVSRGLEIIVETRDETKVSELEERNQLKKREISLWTLELEILGRDLEKDGGTDPERLKNYNEKLANLVAHGGAPAQLAILNAQSLLAQQKWHEALDVLRSVRRTAETIVALRREIDLAIATCFKQLANPMARIQTLEKGLATDILWHKGRLELARIQARQGNLDEAAAHNRFLTEHRIDGSWVRFMNIRLQQFRKLPEDRRNYAFFDRNLKNAERYTEDEPAIAILRADFARVDSRLARETRIAASEKFLVDAKEKHPDSTELVVAHAFATATRPDRNATQRLAAAIAMLKGRKTKEESDTAMLKSSLARLTSLMKPEDAVPLLDELLVELKDEFKAEAEDEAKIYSPSLRRRVLESIAGAYERHGKIESSLAIWKRIAELSPNDLRARLALASIAIRLKNPDSLRDALKATRAIDGDGSAWAHYFEAIGLINVALRKITNGRKAFKALPESQREAELKVIQKDIEATLLKAKAHLESGQRLQPNWPEFPNRLGFVAELLRNDEDAQREYQHAIDLGDRTAAPYIYVANRLRGQNKIDEATAIIKKAQSLPNGVFSRSEVDLTDNKATLTEIAIDLAFRNEEISEIERLLPDRGNGYSQKILRADFRYLEYTNLSEDEKKLPRAKKLLEEADQLYRDALSEAKDFPQPWIGRVYQLARHGRENEALPVIQQALETLPKEMSLITAARCYAILGKSAETGKYLEDYIKESPADALRRFVAVDYYSSQKQITKVISHLDQILAPNFKATKRQRDHARQLLIEATAKVVDYSELAKVAAKIPDNDKATIRDLYSRIRVHESRPLKKDRDVVIATLEEIKRRKKLNSIDHFQLARLYLRNGRWDDARRTVESLIEKDPESTLLLSWLAVQTLAHETHTPEVLKRVRKLISRLRNSGSVTPSSAMSTLLAEADLLIAEKKTDDAIKLIEAGVKRLINDRTKLKSEEAKRLLLIARFTEHKKLEGLTDRILQQYGQLSEKPETVLSRAIYHGRNGRYRKALEICVAAKKTADPVLVGIAASNIVALGRPTDEDLKTAQSLLDAALKAKPKSLQLLWEQAGLHIAAGNLEAGEALYRELTKKNPKNVAFLNNYAWVLAMQDQKLEEALTLIDLAIAKKGPLGAFLDTRGIILLRLRRNKQAVNDLKQAVAEDPAPLHLFHLAMAHLAVGDRVSAAAALKKAEKAGLSVDSLHRLEQPGYLNLKTKLRQSEATS